MGVRIHDRVIKELTAMRGVAAIQYELGCYHVWTYDPSKDVPGPEHLYRRYTFLVRGQVVDYWCMTWDVLRIQGGRV